MDHCIVARGRIRVPSDVPPIIQTSNGEFRRSKQAPVAERTWLLGLVVISTGCFSREDFTGKVGVCKQRSRHRYSVAIASGNCLANTLKCLKGAGAENLYGRIFDRVSNSVRRRAIQSLEQVRGGIGPGARPRATANVVENRLVKLSTFCPLPAHTRHLFLDPRWLGGISPSHRAIAAHRHCLSVLPTDGGLAQCAAEGARMSLVGGSRAQRPPSPASPPGGTGDDGFRFDLPILWLVRHPPPFPAGREVV